MPNALWRKLYALPSTNKPKRTKTNEHWSERLTRINVRLNKIGHNLWHGYDGETYIVKWLKSGQHKSDFERVYFKNLDEAEQWINDNIQNLKN